MEIEGCRRFQQRERHVDHARVAAGAIDVGRVVDVLRDCHPGGDEDQGPERHPLPDIRDDVGPSRDPFVHQEQWSVLSGDRTDQAVGGPHCVTSIRWIDVKTIIEGNAQGIRKIASSERPPPAPVDEKT